MAGKNRSIHLVRTLTLNRFDMYLPENWPVEPPIVYFVLEGHDFSRGGFNPNLHPDGKC